MGSTDGLESTKEPLFRLQVEALLEEVKVQPKQLSQVPKVLKKLQKFLNRLPTQKVDGSVACNFLEAAGLPSDLTLDFLPPESVAALGSFSTDCMTAPHAVVDVAIQLPSSCLPHKAYLNGRYWSYRALYLTVLAEALKARPLFSKHSWEALGGEPHRPVLLLTLQSQNEDTSSNNPHQPPTTLRLLPCIPPGTFPLAKFAPNRNTLRDVCEVAKEGEPAAPRNGQQEGVDAEGRKIVLLPTPSHNSGLLHDLLITTHQEYVQTQLKKDPLLVDALRLLKVWWRQCSLNSSRDTLTGHSLLMLLLLLKQTGRLVDAMSPLQTFRATVALLSTPSWHKHGLAMAQEALPGLGADPPSLSLMREHFPVVIQDFTGWVNLAAGMTPSAATQVEWCARHALKVLDGPLDPDTAFRSLFLTPSSLPSMFDYIWRVNYCPASAAQSVQDKHPWRQQEAEVRDVVVRALGNRAKWVRVLPRVGKGSSNMQTLCTASPSHITIAAVMDATQITRVLDIGPPAVDKAAAKKFREVWGEKSELRRFPDGTISEAVLWQAPAHQRHLIPDMAVKHLLHRRLGVTEEKVECSCAALDSVLGERGVEGPAGVEAQRLLDAAVERLGSLIRGVEGTVLKVLSVLPISPAINHTATFPPLPHLVAGGSPLVGASSSSQLGRCVEAVEVLVQLEGSGRWPDAPVAYSKAKAAVGVQLAKALESTPEATVVCQASEACLDVLLLGFAFRLLLATSREDAILAKMTAEDFKSTDLPLRHMRHMDARVWLTGAVNSVSAQHAAFAPAVRLAKRWVGCQVLSNHLSESLVELLMCAVFSPAARPLSIPASRTTGFLRWLQLLSQHPWSHVPLLVDPLQELSYAQRAAIQEPYLSQSGSGRRPMHICTKHDPTSNWSELGPSKQAVVRIVAVATYSAALLQALLTTGSCQDPFGNIDRPSTGSLPLPFRTPVEDFDLSITINSAAVPFARRAVPRPSFTRDMHALSTEREEEEEDAGEGEPAPKRARVNLKSIPQKLLDKKGVAKLQPELLVGFNPMGRYLSLLQERYGHIASFWADELSGDLILVKWHSAGYLPSAMNMAEAHIALHCSLTCQSKQWIGSAVPNVVQLLASMKNLAVGYVDSICHCPKRLALP